MSPEARHAFSRASACAKGRPPAAARRARTRRRRRGAGVDSKSLAGLPPRFCGAPGAKEPVRAVGVNGTRAGTELERALPRRGGRRVRAAGQHDREPVGERQGIAIAREAAAVARRRLFEASPRFEDDAEAEEAVFVGRVRLERAAVGRLRLGGGAPAPSPPVPSPPRRPSNRGRARPLANIPRAPSWGARSPPRCSPGCSASSRFRATYSPSSRRSPNRSTRPGCEERCGRQTRQRSAPPPPGPGARDPPVSPPRGRRPTPERGTVRPTEGRRCARRRWSRSGRERWPSAETRFRKTARRARCTSLSTAGGARARRGGSGVPRRRAPPGRAPARREWTRPTRRRRAGEERECARHISEGGGTR